MVKSIMKQFLQRANDFFENVPDWVRRYRIIVWLSFIVLTVLVVAGAQRFRIDMTMEAYFQKDDPTKLAYDLFRDEFGSDEVLFLTYRAKDGDVFSPQSLIALQALHKELTEYRLAMPSGQTSGLDRITDVTSLINASYMEGSAGELLSKPLIGDELPSTDVERERLRTKALNHPDFPGVYLSPDSQYGSIVIETDLGASRIDEHSAEQALDGGVQDDETLDVEAFDTDFDMDTQWRAGDEQAEIKAPAFEQVAIEDFARFMHAIEPIIAKPEYTEFFQFYPAGGAVLMTFFNDVMMQQMALILICSIALILAVLWLLFRSLSAVLWSMSIVIVSLLWVLGLIGWSGALMTMMINIVVFLVIAVGVADAVHILSGYLYFRRVGEEHQQALRSVFKKSGLACFLTSLTTAIGLAALTLVPIIPVRNFGIFAAIGVLVAFLMTVFLLPLMLDLWAPVKRQTTAASKPSLIQRLLRSVETLGYSHPKKIIAVFGAITIYLVVGIFDIKVDSNMVALLPEDTLVRQSVDVVDQHMAGSSVMEIIFDAGQADAFNDPDILNRMEGLQMFIERQYPDMVGKTSSLVNISKDSFKAFNDDDPAMYTIPQEPNVLAQTLFMFNSANPEDRRQFVSDDYSKARMTITLKNAGSYVYIPMIDEIQQEVDSLFASAKPQYPALDIRLTGSMSLMIKLVDYISWSQIKSFGLALCVISALLLLVFGSKRIGLIALLPNLLPIILAFGLMGHLGIPLDTDTLLIAPIIIGIAVDDTIHFLTHYRASMHQTGHIPSAIRMAIREAGQAIAFTSLILSIGFLVFLFSEHLALRNFGVLSSMAIMFALITDLLLLPALCMLFKADFNQSRKNNNDEISAEPSATVSL